MGVNHICGGGRPAQCAYRPGVVRTEGLFIQAARQAGEHGLTAGAPGLGDTPGRRNRSFPAPAYGLNERGHLAVSALKGDQGTGIEYQAHSRGSLVMPGCSVPEQPVSLGHLGFGQLPMHLLP